jgi:hypothetical protein
VLSIELLGSLLIEPRHLQFGNIKAVSIDSINHLSCLSVNIGLDHGKRFLTSLVELGSSENITIVDQLELSVVNSYDRPNVEILD